ncbi:MAG: hypothetical protein AAFU53_12535 [Cyanobacteria bacterium J06632_3]
MGTNSDDNRRQLLANIWIDSEILLQQSIFYEIIRMTGMPKFTDPSH